MTDSSTPSTPDAVLPWIVVGSIVLSLLVLPVAVVWLGAYDGLSSVRLSTRGFGLVTMVPGILLGLTSLVVMLGSR